MDCNRFFNLVINFIIDEIEKGYTVDTGGETKFGISKKAFPEIDVHNLTKEEAIKIYEEHFWRRNKCDKICEYDPKIAAQVFDTSINMGLKKAIYFLQLVIKNKNPSIILDGIIGPQTLGMLRDLDSDYVYYTYLYNRVDHYRYLANKSTYRPYLLGWLNRVHKLDKFLKHIYLEEVNR